MNKKMFSMFLAIAVLPLLFSSCSKDDDDFTFANGNLVNVQMIALNTNGETKEADALLICNDGSYVLCDADNGNGYSTIYINTSVNNDFTKGTILFLDEEGTPIIASTENGQFIFKNITDNSFDFAFIGNRGDISYYWDIPFPYNSDTRMTTTRAFYDPLVNSWKSWKSSVVDFDWTWDEHQKKAIVPFLCKMGSFVITAVGIVRGTGTHVDRAVGVYTVFDEANKSDIINANWLNYASSSVDFIDLVESSSEGGWSSILKNGKLSFSKSGFGLSVLANFLNQYGDNELANLGKYEEWVAPTFEGKEWQIKLSTYLLECTMDEATYSVDVSTKAAWEIDDSNINHSWCSITKENGRVVVKVKEYDGIEDRVCSAKIKTSAETNDIPPATLTIKQSGVLFEISTPELIFTQEGGEQGINVNTNKNVASWKVTARPDWCKTQEWEAALIVTVQEDAHLLEDREGVITLTAQLVNGETIDRFLNVKQVVQDMWNGTKWNFSGSVNASGNMAMVGNISMSEVTNFGIEIRDVDRNDFSLSGDLAGLEKDSHIYCDAENHLIWSHSETISESGASMKMTTSITFTRTSSTTATGKMNSSANVNVPGYGGINISLNGNFSGTRIDIDN